MVIIIRFKFCSPSGNKVMSTLNIHLQFCLIATSIIYNIRLWKSPPPSKETTLVKILSNQWFLRAKFPIIRAVWKILISPSSKFNTCVGRSFVVVAGIRGFIGFGSVPEDLSYEHEALRFREISGDGFFVHAVAAIHRYIDIKSKLIT